jgi:hypothetical protein
MHPATYRQTSSLMPRTGPRGFLALRTSNMHRNELRMHCHERWTRYAGRPTTYETETRSTLGRAMHCALQPSTLVGEGGARVAESRT